MMLLKKKEEQEQIKWFKSAASLSEIYQQTGMVFAFATKPDEDKKQEMCHQWVKCRDFLHDAVRSEIVKGECAIYNFKYKAGENPSVDIRRMRMLVSSHSVREDKDVEAFRNKMKAALVLLNHFEKHMKISLSTMKEIPPAKSGKKVVFLFTGSGIWMKSPFLVSMYTFLIRLGHREIEFKSIAELKEKLNRIANDKNNHDNDASYLKECWDKLHTIVENRGKLFKLQDGFHEVYFRSASIGAFHNNCGILSLARATTPFADINDLVKKETNQKCQLKRN